MPSGVKTRAPASVSQAPDFQNKRESEAAAREVREGRGGVGNRWTHVRDGDKVGRGCPKQTEADRDGQGGRRQVG